MKTLKNLIDGIPDADTVERRVLPVLMAFVAGLLVAGLTEDGRIELELQARAEVLCMLETTKVATAPAEIIEDGEVAQ